MACLMMTPAIFFTLLFIFGQFCSRRVEAGAAHATLYGGSDASGMNNGACGYSNVFSMGYITLTTALSGPLFNDGLSCGACYLIQCSGDPSCLGGSSMVTATNLCPQGSFGGWCDAPNYHFDLFEPAFQQIAQVIAGHVSVSYQKVSCSRSGGIRFSLQGHTYFLQIVVWNVGGAGDVNSMSIKGSNSGLISMSRSWGQVYTTPTVLDGQSLSISVTTSDSRTVTSDNVAGSGWQYGQTYEGSQF